MGIGKKKAMNLVEASICSLLSSIRLYTFESAQEKCVNRMEYIFLSFAREFE